MRAEVNVIAGTGEHGRERAFPVERRTPAERALREQNLCDRLEWAERKVRSGWYRAILVTAGGPGAFLGMAVYGWGGGDWPLLAWPVLLWLLFVSGWTWWIVRRDREEKAILERRLRGLDVSTGEIASWMRTGPGSGDSPTTETNSTQE